MPPNFSNLLESLCAVLVRYCWGVFYCSIKTIKSWDRFWRQ